MANKKQQPERITIEPHWLEVLRELDKKMIAARKEPSLRTNQNRGTEAEQKEYERQQLNDPEAVTFLELTAIASTKDLESVQDTASCSCEEDEDCDYKSVENDILRSRQKYWTFEVAPLDRTHPQMPYSYGFITGKTYQSAKAKLLALPDAGEFEEEEEEPEPETVTPPPPRPASRKVAAEDAASGNKCPTCDSPMASYRKTCKVCFATNPNRVAPTPPPDLRTRLTALLAEWNEELRVAERDASQRVAVKDLHKRIVQIGILLRG